MRAVIPDAADLVYAELYSDPPELAPLPEEEPLIAKSVPKRRNEFVTVRHCARVALEQLGVAPAPILKGEKGEPCWPDGVVGSLTHCRGAVVGLDRSVRSVGIDAEPHGVLPDGVLNAVSLPVERYEIGALPGGLHWDRILFCAKEATYKAWYPLTGVVLHHEQVRVQLTADGTFRAEASDGIRMPLRVEGRWRAGPDVVLTLAAVAAREVPRDAATHRTARGAASR